MTGITRISKKTFERLLQGESIREEIKCRVESTARRRLPESEKL